MSARYRGEAISGTEFALLADLGGLADADAVAQLAHRVRLLQAAALTPDHVALEDLDPLLAALDHADVNLELVAGEELGDVVAQRSVVYEVGRLHGVSLRAGPGSAVTKGLAKDTGPVGTLPTGRVPRR